MPNPVEFDSTEVPSSEALASWLTSRLAVYLDIETGRVDPEATFESQGLDSMGALALCDDIEDHLDIVVEPTLAWDYPNITALAAFLHKTREQLTQNGSTA